MVTSQNCFQQRDGFGILVRVPQPEMRYTSVILQTLCHQIVIVYSIKVKKAEKKQGHLQKRDATVER